MFVSCFADEMIDLPMTLATSNPYLSPRRENSGHACLLFRDRLPRRRGQLSSRELHCLALGCHVTHEQKEVNEGDPHERNSVSILYRLVRWWCKIFPDSTLEFVSMDECPVLIGVMRCTLTTGARGLPLDYDYRVLLRRDTLSQTVQISTPKKLLELLRTFTDDWHHNEKLLVSVLFVDFNARSVVPVVRFQ